MQALVCLLGLFLLLFELLIMRSQTPVSLLKSLPLFSQDLTFISTKTFDLSYLVHDTMLHVLFLLLSAMYPPTLLFQLSQQHLKAVLLNIHHRAFLDGALGQSLSVSSTS